MSTLTKINSLRILISDPHGIINISTKNLISDLPSSPAPQTMYYVSSEEQYYQTDKEKGVRIEDYYIPTLYLSNSTLSSLIDTYGETKAAYRALRRISLQLSGELNIVRQSSGESSTEFVELLNMYKYYKNLIQDLIDDENSDDDNNSGVFGSMHPPTIAGGNI